MADDNSQDYEGYHRASENNPGEEPASTSDEKEKDAPDLTDDEDDDMPGGSNEAANNPGMQGGSNSDDNAGSDNQQSGSAVKDPKDWTTGDEPATAAQKSYISTMAVETHEEVPFELTKAEASRKIEELQQKTGRDPSTERP